jgi:hypothetical protein
MTPVLESFGRLPSRSAVPAGAAGYAIPLAIVFLAALVLRHVVVANTDVAWQITIAERLLAGQQLYVDLIEVNPPAPSYLYLLPVVVARWLGLRAEIVIDTWTFVAIGASLWFSATILRRGRLLDTIDGRILLAVSAAVLALLPAQTFSEREHLATLALLPFLALMAVRAMDRGAAASVAVAAGFAGGLAMVLKPHLALGVGAAGLTLLAHRRSLRPLLLPENVTAGLIAAAYVAGIALFFPRYISEMMPLMTAVYVPMRSTYLALLHLPSPWMWAALLLAIAAADRQALLRPPVRILVAASVGLLAAYVVQAKGWPYQSYPMLATLALALGFVAARTDPQRRGPANGRTIALATLALMAGPLWTWMNLADDHSDLAGPIRQLKPNPSMLVLTSDFSVGHPLVRLVGGRWVSHTGSLWISEGTESWLNRDDLDPERRSRLSAYRDWDRSLLLDDIRRHRPDIIVVERFPYDREAWWRADPELSGLMAAYRPAFRRGNFVVMERSE